MEHQSPRRRSRRSVSWADLAVCSSCGFLPPRPSYGLDAPGSQQSDRDQARAHDGQIGSVGYRNSSSGTMRNPPPAPLSVPYAPMPTPSTARSVNRTGSTAALWQKAVALFRHSAYHRRLLRDLDNPGTFDAHRLGGLGPGG